MDTKSLFQRQKDDMHEDLEPFLADTDGIDIQDVRNNQSHLQRLLHGLVVLSGSFFVTSIVFYLVYARRFVVTDETCNMRMSAYSPARTAVKYNWVTYDDAREEQQYSGKPSETLEETWKALWYYGAFGFPAEMLRSLNKSNSPYPFLGVGTGRGEGGVAGQMEAFHQVHCVNLLRQYIYRDQWDYSGLKHFHDGEAKLRWHLNHCIMTLKVNILCHSDVSMVLIESGSDGLSRGKWSPASPPKKCKDWGKLVDWMQAHELLTKEHLAAEH